MLFILGCAGSSLLQGLLSLVVVCGLLTMAASLLQSLGSRLQALRSCSSRASLPHGMRDLPR